ncbi:NYN domain-containing protein [Candidatus Woesearchaeota archaeon]|nr:NYN domain-containing protein [Candidatus Woesearchaeota archaeon]
MGRLQVQRDEKGEIIKKADGYPLLKQKGVDMWLGIDVAKLAATKQIQRIVLVAGDSDFVPAIIAAKAEGVLVTLYYSSSGVIHDSLYEVCDDRIAITKELLEKCRRERRLRI